MRKTFVGALVVLGVAAVALPRSAAASLPATACSSSALKVCAAVSASTYQASTTTQSCSTTHPKHGPPVTTCANVTTTTWHLILHVWNLFGTAGGGVSHAITYVGVGSSGYTGTGSLYSAKFNGNAIDRWQTANSINGNPVGAELDLASQTKNGINNALVGCGQSATSPPYATCYPSGAFLELDFLTGHNTCTGNGNNQVCTFTSSQFDLNDPTAVYGWHSQDVNGQDCSLWVASDGKQTTDTDHAACSSVVPEPVTIVLLGSGLASMGGFGLVRRRKRNGDIEST